MSNDQVLQNNDELSSEVAKRVMSQNQWLVLLLLIANGLVLVFVNNNTMALAIGNLIGGCISSLWQERQMIISFFYGSSLGSKLKDAAVLKKREGS